MDQKRHIVDAADFRERPTDELLADWSFNVYYKDSDINQDTYLAETAGYEFSMKANTTRDEKQRWLQKDIGKTNQSVGLCRVPQCAPNK